MRSHKGIDFRRRSWLCFLKISFAIHLLREPLLTIQYSSVYYEILNSRGRHQTLHSNIGRNSRRIIFHFNTRLTSFSEFDLGNNYFNYTNYVRYKCDYAPWHTTSGAFASHASPSHNYNTTVSAQLTCHDFLVRSEWHQMSDRVVTKWRSLSPYSECHLFEVNVNSSICVFSLDTSCIVNY